MRKYSNSIDNKIVIDDNGMVYIPATVSMRDFEIAELFDIMIPTVKGKIKTLLKSRFISNCSGGIVMGSSIIPEYFGLEVVISIAFQTQSIQAETFRKYVINQITKSDTQFQPMFIQLSNSNIFN